VHEIFVTGTDFEPQGIDDPARDKMCGNDQQYKGRQFQQRLPMGSEYLSVQPHLTGCWQPGRQFLQAYLETRILFRLSSTSDALTI
jgi:hypothetical protein